MAVAIRYMIQKEVFSAEDRVLVIASVTKPGRKKKPSFLVVSGKYCSHYSCLVPSLSVT